MGVFLPGKTRAASTVRVLQQLQGILINRQSVGLFLSILHGGLVVRGL